MKDEIGTGIADAGVISEIYGIVRDHTKEEYKTIIAQNASYPFLYHLAEVRANIVDWLPVRKTDAVLEVSAECGALSETLLRKGGSLTYITDTKLQKEVVELRLKKNVPHKDGEKSVTGYFGRFSDVEPKLGKYDAVILSGALGYAGEMLGRTEGDPYRRLIGILKAHLKPGGMLVLIDANRLGLKYLAGCQEEHFGGYFRGIQNYEGCKGYRTFTRKEYGMMLRDAGMREVAYYYPYPDYKFPVTIYSDRYLPKEGELNDNMRNVDRDRYILFNELAAYNTLIAEGLFGEFSNSFLIIAREGRAD